MFRSISFMVAVVMGVMMLGAAQAEVNTEGLKDLLDDVSAEHPRLYVTKAEWPELEARVMGDPLLRQTYEQIQAHADAYLDLEPLKREQIGRRLLSVSRMCIKRVTYLSMAYRMTSDLRYARRAEQEMLAVAAFSDWNPSHYLDVAEMTAGMAMGYDWLYPVLDPEARVIIRDAIIEKGLNTSLKGGWWVTSDNNWNQVCHGGLTLGALAVLEDEPELAYMIIERGISNLHNSMDEYEPHGVYPEGPGYWRYGTSFNVILIAALESVLGSDFGLMEAEGFKKSPYFYLHETGSTGDFFNFADCGTGGGGVSMSMHWFANKLNDPGLLWHERGNLEDYVEEGVDPLDSGERTMVFLLTWAQPIASVPEPTQLFFHGDGASPVMLSRSAWNEDATFLGAKGGSPSSNHGHMDIGSFVLDMKGERWAVDLGSQSYHGLETNGVEGLWMRTQDSQRWTVFRLNNFSHNTLSVDGALQQVEGYAPIVAASGDTENPYGIMDMSEVYQGQLAKALRGLKHSEDWVLIQDEVQALDKDTSVRWGMTTHAKVTVTGSTTAVMEQGGEQVTLKVLSPAGVKVRVESVEIPPMDFDAENPDTRRIMFDVPLKASASETIVVQISAEADTALQIKSQALSEWK